MNINEELYDLAERFVSGDITDKDHQLAKELTENSPEFKKYVEQIKLANKVLFLEGLSSDLKTIVVAEEKYLFRKRFLKPGIWIASALLVSLGVYLLLQKTDGKKSDGVPKQPKNELNTIQSTSSDVAKIESASSLNSDGNQTQTKISKENSLANLNVSETPKKDTATTKNLPSIQKDVTSVKNDSVTKEVSDPCKNKIEFLVQSVSTCLDKNEGSIRVTKVSGGTSPYSFKLDNQKYNKNTTFNFLSSGAYTVYAKDANGCTAEKSLTVETKNCIENNNHFLFSYRKGEDFIVPTADKDATFYLFDNSGNELIKIETRSNTQTLWNGYSENGQRLNTGLYPFKLISENSDLIISGTITIVD